MVLLHFMTEEGQASRARLLAGALGASVASVLLLLIVNLAAAEIVDTGQDQVDWILALSFVAAATLYFFAESDLVREVGAAMEAGVDRVRLRLLDGVRAADYAAIERVGSSTLFESITQSSSALSQNSQFIALSIRSALLTVMIQLYILSLSPVAFTLILLGTVSVGVMYSRLGGALGQRYAAMMGQEQRLFRAVEDLLDGYREVRLSSARSRELAEHFAQVSSASTAIRIQVQGLSFQKLIFGHVAFFFLLGLVVFVLPEYFDGLNEDIIKIAAAVIFMIGPLGGVIQAVAVMASAEAAVSRMLALDRELAAMIEPGREHRVRPWAANFSSIHLDGVRYRYPGAEDEPGFAVGPLDLELRQGEVLFITGGNGSGKSSFVKLLTGLYRPTQGQLRVDDQAVLDRNRRGYRELFATVFSDQFLFPRLYGLNEFDEVEIQQHLKWLEIEHVVDLYDGVFSRVDLSSGQRKRVLLLAALLEHRPVLVLDEWAADQDPQFRHKFYREILPALKARGMTIVAVTHDDHYFDVADRRLHFEEGRMSELLRPEER